MSVDYESVLIYGFRITAKDIKCIKENIGADAWDILRETYDGYDHHYQIIRENSYHDKSDYFFGITLGDELDLDSIDAICWAEYETSAMEEEFERVFGSMDFAEISKPMMYHFVRVC